MEHLEQQSLEGLVLTTSGHETQPSYSVREYSDPPIPDDLLISIFSLVPLKSIARFRCVSKVWASILRRSDFTELFLTKSLTRPRLFFTVETGEKLLFYSSPQPHNSNDNSSVVATPYHYCKIDPTYGPPYISNRSLYSKPNNKTQWILTLESGKRLWRKLEPEFNFKTNGNICGDICINGVLYFEGTLEGSSVIVCFDVRSEKFSFINKDEDMLPPKLSDHWSIFLTLFNYRDKLGIRCQVEQKLVLWVVEDAGNHKWSKRNIELSPCLKELKKNAYSWTIVGMTGTGEIVFSPWDSCVFFYNIERNTFRRIDIQGLGAFWDPSLDYVENLKFI